VKGKKRNHVSEAWPNPKKNANVRSSIEKGRLQKDGMNKARPRVSAAFVACSIFDLQLEGVEPSLSAHVSFFVEMVMVSNPV
jgi:hypothetical protein